MRKNRSLTQAILGVALFCMSTQSTFAALLNLTQTPLFVGANVPPRVMLTISKDQQIFKKAYNDYSDLDNDGVIETTYKHAIDYYGYFDSAKCYNYNATTNRFEPAAISATKYCSGQWSGNFLNWLAMSRIDAVRKLLYGGMRSTDQTFASGGANAVTVLERSYLPTEAHAWSKYYGGADIAQLTPFTVATAATPFSATTSSSFNIPNVSGDYDVPFTTAMNTTLAVGDQVRVQRAGNSGQYFTGVVTGFLNSNRTVKMRINVAGVRGSGADTNWMITNFSDTGMSFCNLTTGSTTSGNVDSRSSTNTRPPLIRVARGNYTLWGANERWQCMWSEERSNLQGGFAGGLLSNGNQGTLSELQASAENPSRTTKGLGTGSAVGEYIARVQACVPSLIGNEKCKQYPNGNYKPVGLLQDYGDTNRIQFGLMTGSHAKNISGGVVRKNAGPISDEVNVGTDGTFVQPYRPPGAPRTQSSTATPPGIINTLNYMRMYGYLYTNGTYIGTSGDNCTYQLTTISENSCTSWGNPMSEMFFESVRYMAGKTPTPAYVYSGSSKDNELGLPIATWVDPLASAPYCSPLNVVVFNASVSSYDDDLRGTSAADINASGTLASLTNTVGDAEGITNSSYFVGKLIGGSPTPTTDPGFELCTGKTIAAFGDVSGICPEGPTAAGSYLMAGAAHRAHTNRIRTDVAVPSSDTTSLKVTSFGIQLATNVPRLAITVPGSTSGQQVVIQPIYRLDLGSGNFGGGSLVDMKFVRQSTSGLITTGKVYVNWEDSEQGGDYDQDMWGTIDWTLDANFSPPRLTVTTNAIAASSANPQGFGYTVSGTTKDGAHFHSGIYNFNYTDPTGVLGCTNCNLAGTSGQTGPQSVRYTLGATAANALKDPLWYLAKYGAFNDSNGNNLPDTQSEWDATLADGSPGQDGVPDNYFLVSNPLGLEAALNRAFVTILAQATAASVATNSTSLQTTSTIYQARFNSKDWSGQVLAYGVSADGSLNATPDWDAGQVINTQSWSSRAILTFNDTIGVRTGVPFRWPLDASSPTVTEITLNLVTALSTNPDTNLLDSRGSSRLQYLRGDGSLEVGASRFRSRPTSKLGDIVNSDPAYVGAPNSPIADPTYAAFVTANASRAPMLYVGANDGMLHAFDAGTGREVLAYVPSKVFGNLNKLTSLNYAHRYFVDGAPEVADARVGGQWRTTLVGGLGGGGHGLYALDVTTPSAFSEANAAGLVLWEFNDSDDADLGYVYGKPAIRKMANGRWAAIVSGGYHSQGDSVVGSGRGVLFVIFLDGPTGLGRTWVAGTDYIKIDTGVGSTTTPNGLAAPLAVDTNLDGATDFVYAGDQLGNLWKFDLSSATTSNWTLAANRISLFQARDSLGNVQPITSQPEGTIHPSGRGYVIVFGTGKYIEVTDPSGPYYAQSFYGIWDKNDNPTSISNQTRVTSRAQLLQQTVTNVSSGGVNYRVVSNFSPNWSTDTTPPTADDSPVRHVGWFMDFPDSATTGERSVFRPLILSNRLIFTTLTPSTAVCAFGGSSYMFIVDPATGARIEGAVLDVDGNGKLDSADKISSGGVSVFASGVESKVGIMPTPTIIAGGGTPSGSTTSTSRIYGTSGPLRQGYGSVLAYAIGGGSTGNRSSAVIGLGSLSGRVSWREVLTR